MKAMFFIALALYGAAVILEFTGTAFKKDRLLKAAWYVFLAAFAVHTLFIIVRGVAAKRLPLSNQFEFANAFAWGVALMLIVMRRRLKTAEPMCTPNQALRRAGIRSRISMGCRAA